MKTSTLLEMSFRDACEAWLKERVHAREISEKSAHEYQLNINRLSKSFGMLHLGEIDADLIRKYQREREDDGVGASGINHECSILQQLLKRVRRWPDIQSDYHPIKLPKWKPGRIISEVERERLFRIAAENPNWEAAYLFAIISVNTTAGPKEVATLRHKDVNLGNRKFMIQPEGAKRDERIRTLTLNDDAWPAMVQAVGRAQRLGSTEDWHYIFPARFNGSKKYDPTRYQGSFKTAWLKMVAAAELPGLKMYDLRRTAITDLLADENNAEETVIKIAGHVGRDMLKHYSYRRLDKIRDALDRLPYSYRKKPDKPDKPRIEVEKKKPSRSVDKGDETIAELREEMAEMRKQMLRMAEKLLEAKQ